MGDTGKEEHIKSMINKEKAIIKEQKGVLWKSVSTQ